MLEVDSGREADGLVVDVGSVGSAGGAVALVWSTVGKAVETEPSLEIGPRVEAPDSAVQATEMVADSVAVDGIDEAGVLVSRAGVSVVTGDAGGDVASSADLPIIPVLAGETAGVSGPTGSGELGRPDCVLAGSEGETESTLNIAPAGELEATSDIESEFDGLEGASCFVATLRVVSVGAIVVVIAGIMAEIVDGSATGEATVLVCGGITGSEAMVVSEARGGLVGEEFASSRPGSRARPSTGVDGVAEAGVSELETVLIASLLSGAIVSGRTLELSGVDGDSG